MMSVDPIPTSWTGTPRAAGSDRPLLLEGTGAWLVRRGRVDVFAVALRDGEPAGSRRHLFRVESGEMLFGTGGAGELGLLAVGIGGSELLEIRREALEKAARDPSRAADVAARVEEWVDRLCEGVGAAGLPEGCVELCAGEASPEGPGVVARPSTTVAWIRHVEGASLLAGMEGLKVNGTGYTPLSRRAWLAVGEGSRLEVRETAAVVASGEAWPGLDRLHALVLEATRRFVADAAAAERERLRRKAEAGRGSFGDAWMELASTLDGAGSVSATAAPAAAAGGDALVAAARVVGAALDLRIRRPPRGSEPAAEADSVEAIARASKVRTRRVLLRDGWWAEDGGPLLGRRAEGGHPVALLPVPGPAYVIRDPATGAAERVTAAVAETLEGVAHTFYRSFPDRALGIADVVRFGLWGCRGDLARVAVISTAAGLLSLIPPIATGMIFNDVIPGAARGQLLQITLVLIAIAIASALLNLANGIALVRIDTRMGSSTQAAVWDRLLRLPMPFFRPYAAGDLATRAMNVNAIRQVLSSSTLGALIGGGFSLLHLGLLFHYSPGLAAWAALLIALAVGAAVLASAAQLRSQRAAAEGEVKLAGSVLQYLTSVAKLRVAGAEVYAFARWAAGFSRLRRLQFRVRSTGNLLSAFTAGYPLAANVVLFALAMPLLGASELRTGDFLAFMASFGTCLAGTLGASAALLGTLAVIPLYEQARPILEALPEADVDRADPGPLRGDIEVQHVSFRYASDGPPILRDVNLSIRAGEFVAFVGPSGSGKSTLLRLLLGFESPESGSICYDGQEMEGVDVHAVRRQIGVVLQAGRLMPGDVYTNIVGSGRATLDDAWEAARAAGLEDDIRGMPMGMHTVVSEGAGTLSGGQRQRLMIARALVKRPRIVFFDEATSALDNRTQAIVSASLERLRATRVVIAHRLSTIVHADRIVVIDAGRVVQTGTYAELMARPGPFAELAKRQLA